MPLSRRWERKTPNRIDTVRYVTILANFEKGVTVQCNTPHIHIQLDEHCITLFDNRLPSSRTVRD
jgi:hypothetical protein